MSRVARLHRSVLFAMFVVVVFGTAARPDDRLLDDEGKALRQKALSAKSPEQSERALRKLFRHVGRKRLRNLAFDDDTTIALAAQFESAVALRPGEDQRWGLTPNDAERFLAFFEGRTRVLAPDGWERGQDFPGSNEFAVGVEYEYQSVNWKTLDGMETWMAVAKPFRMSVGESSVTLQSGDMSVALQRKDVEALAASGKPYLVVSEVDSHLMVLCHDNCLGDRLTLCCVECASGRIVWTAPVWGTRYRGGIGGFALFDPAISVQSGCVVIEGGGTFGTFVEAFHLKDGAVAFRFSPDGCGYSWNRK